MPIQFKSKLSSAIANATWLDKTIDDATVGKFSLREDSSAHIEDIQLFLNTLRSDVNSNDVELSDHETRISDNETLLVDHETRIGTNETNIGTNTSDILDINNSLGQPNGIATLEGDGKVPASQLPSYVDDVEEYADLASFPVTGETGKIYVAIDTGKTYRWSGSIYVEISASDVNSVNGQTGVVTITKSDVNLSNVTDDAQLKREAGDLNTFTEKATPVIDDIVIIEDSEDSFNKKKVKLANMLGSGGDAGINYISNSQFESDISDWTGDTNLIISHETVNPLRGDGSLKINKGAIDASGQKVSSLLFTVDDADLAKILTISFDKDFSDANYNDGDAKITITQDPSGTPSAISMNGEDIAGGTSVHYARFQTDSTIKDYRLDIEWVSASADAVEVLIDNVTIAPQVINQGAIVTDMEEFTPTGNWNVSTTYSGIKSRIGASVEATVNVAIGADGNTGTFELDASSIGVMSTKQKDLSAVSVVTIGKGSILNNGVDRYPVQVRYITSTDKIQLVLDNASATYATTRNVTDSIPFNVATGDAFQFSFKYNVQGWSSQANMSSDFGGRDVSVIGAGCPVTAIIAGVTNIPFTSTKDTTASWSGDSFKAPVSDDYDVSGMIAASVSNSSTIEVFVDGSLRQFAYLAGGLRYKPYSFRVYLEKDEVLSLRGGGNFTTDNSTAAHTIFIKKSNNPQTSLESETVAARYTSDSGQSITGSVTTIYKYEDKEIDTHDAYNISTGEYITPIDGFYNIHASFGENTLAISPAQNLYIIMYVNGLARKRISVPGTNTTSLFQIGIGDGLELTKGDVLDIRVFSQAAMSASTNSLDNTFSISRIK